MKLLVSDYDGTYATGPIAMMFNAASLKKFIKKGNLFVLSSGRSYNSLTKEVEAHDIPYSYLATCDGSFLFDKHGNNLMYNKMKEDVIKDIQGLISFGVHRQIEFIHEKTYDETHEPGSDLAGVSFIVDKWKITDEFKKEYEKVKIEHPELNFVVYNWHDEYYFMIKPNGVSKSSPIEELRRRLDIPKKKIYTIGDNSNDYEMIRDYNGYMIGNSPDLRKVALKKYHHVYEVVNDIKKKKALKRG